MNSRLVLALLTCGMGAAVAQTFALPAGIPLQFLDQSGNILVGGQVFTCTAGSTCPGTPQATYTDSSGFTAQTDPIVLDASGRAPNAPTGGGIWINTSNLYKFVIQTSTGQTLFTLDNVGASPSQLSIPANYWTLSGTTISNNNASGAGNVSVGANMLVAGNATVTGTVDLRDTNVSANFAHLRAANNMTADVTWRWPASDGVGCLTSDGNGNLSFATCGSGGGGSGSPGGANTTVQFNSAGSFGGDLNFIWNHTSQLLTITALNSSTAGLGVATGFIQSDGGVLATTGVCVKANCIQAPSGGMEALSFSAVNYIQAGNSNGVPAATTGDAFHAGALYYDTGATTMQVFNGTAWVTLATGGATSPGGASTQVQFNSSGSFAGSANLTYTSQQLRSIASSSASAGMAVGTGFMQADAGFLATTGVCVSFNCIQAPSGGMEARSFSATTYVQTGNNAGVPTVTASDAFHAGALYYDTTIGQEQVFNGTSWGSLGSGGGSGSPGGANTNVQFNSSGSFGGVAQFTWNTASKLLTVLGNASTASIAVGSGFIQSDQGFLATSGTCNTFNCLQAPTGGATGRSLTATTYIQAGNNTSGPPSVTSGDAFHAGALYWDIAIGAMQVFNGSTWASLGTSSGGGTPGGPVNAVQFNNGTTFAGSSNFVWNNSARQFSVFTTPGIAGIGVASGFIQSDGGFLATTSTCTSFACFNAPTAGFTGLSFTATKYVQTGNSFGTPPVTTNDTFHAGAMFWNTATGTEQVFDGAVFRSLATGGIPTLNGLSGALAITGSVNEITVTPSGSDITITTPQQIATTSAVNFASVTTTGTVASSASGSALAFQSGGGNFQVNGSGAVSAAGVISSTGASGGVNVTGDTARNSIQSVGGIAVCIFSTCAGGAALTVGGNVIISSAGGAGFPSAVTFNGGISMGAATNSTIITGASGNIYLRPLAGASTAVSCSGVADGWAAFSTDGFLVTCRGGARFRAAVVAF